LLEMLQGGGYAVGPALGSALHQVQLLRTEATKYTIDAAYL